MFSVACNLYENDYLNSREIKMSKKLILGLALAVVLVSGAFFGARADCGCLPHISLPSCVSCASARDMDRDKAASSDFQTYGLQGNWEPGQQ
jgi:hypothetical protein